MPLHFDLAYGDSTLPLDVPDSVTPVILRPGGSAPLADPMTAVRAALADPTGTEPLADLLRARKPGRVVVVVNDETRPTPYGILLPPLLECFAAAGIADDQVVFLIATGIHAPHSDALNERIFGAELTRRFRFISHVATDEATLADLGPLPSGYDFKVNRLAVEADFLITLGVVMPHYFAGFSGGRKSILPGLAGKDTVRNNHARMVEIMDAMPPIRENPISLEMIAAARKVGVDFILNVVTDDKGRPVKIAAGDLVEAWYAAVDASAAIYEVPFTEQVDICVVSACGYPRDVNMYQAQKALDHADHITAPGGEIILAAQARDGYGEDVFEAWMRKGLPPREVMRRIRESFVIGGHKAYGFAKVADRATVRMITDMDAAAVRSLFAEKAGSVQEAFDAALAARPHARVAILPDGSLTLPVHA